MNYTDITLEDFLFLIAWIVISFGLIVPIIIFLSDFWVKVKEKLGKRLIGVPAWVWRSTLILLIIAIIVISIILYFPEEGTFSNNLNYIIPVLTFVLPSPFAIWQMTMIHRQTDITQQQADIQQQSVHTENYFKAVDNLKHEDIPTRTGAIYGLKNTAQESEDHHLQIVELLCSYIRENATEAESNAQGDNELAIDIQAALDVLGRRSTKWIKKIEGSKPFRMDLEKIYIIKADLTRLNFKRADLEGVHLESAILLDAHLEVAYLKEAHLEGARLMRTHLGGAYLEKAYLEGAYLIGAHLEYAYLYKAQLKDADLSGTQLEGARLWGTDLTGVKNLEQAQIDSTFGDKATKLPKGLTRPKHWLDRAVDQREAVVEWYKWKRDPKNHKPLKE